MPNDGVAEEGPGLLLERRLFWSIVDKCPHIRVENSIFIGFRGPQALSDKLRLVPDR